MHVYKNMHRILNFYNRTNLSHTKIKHFSIPLISVFVFSACYETTFAGNSLSRTFSQVSGTTRLTFYTRMVLLRSMVRG